jgi:hypothetical protein
MRTAEQHLDSVCEGQFPHKERVVLDKGKFQQKSFQF